MSHAILVTEPIVAQDNDGFLLSGNSIFLKEAFRQVKPSTSGNSILGKLAEYKTKFTRLKSFPRNTLLAVEYVYENPSPPARNDDERESAEVADALVQLFKKRPKSKTIVCLEITAGQGSGLGYRLEHLADIIKRTKHANRLGVCLDTAHLFAGGYDFRDRKYNAFVKQLDSTVGLERVKVWHLNDSKKPPMPPQSRRRV